MFNSVGGTLFLLLLDTLCFAFAIRLLFTQINGVSDNNVLLLSFILVVLATLITNRLLFQGRHKYKNIVDYSDKEDLVDLVIEDSIEKKRAERKEENARSSKISLNLDEKDSTSLKKFGNLKREEE